ncbi:hypothetical protein M427DRAFT_48932 [Gonapodya prolifera JEL478]|uniref:5-nitroimidazole antibiotic resistance protein n=1 Tax=Gonapodya prolifera (strain JEL478) TaxID=1344416 RepID=A0A138ZZR2_GONPJ|nr:hypothetical protein M427DRAFT_48932 [Gonapodya prolifera JEL478]|eukprot:KXS09898.1 hypothetical protein M427DRAFT_48932 [Gonapodya prolifera JEL478]
MSSDAPKPHQVGEYLPGDGAINRVRRLQERARYDQENVFKILDAGLVAHVGFAVEGQPFVIPMVYGRKDDTVYIHGYVSARIAKALRTGAPVCINVTLIDGLVLALTPFHHSVNYRSVDVFGHGQLVTDPDEKLDALRRVTDHAVKGRWDDTRPPNKIDLQSTSVIRVDIESASCKMRTGPPSDEEADTSNEELTSKTWVGVLGVETKFTTTVNAGYGAKDVPEYIKVLENTTR